MSSRHDFIIHRFEEFYRITEVLAEGFVPNYHEEDLRLSKDPKDDKYLGIPMVCFFDMEDNDVYEFLQNAHTDYGNYAIMMKKEWALRQKWMNPVWYITDNLMLRQLHKNWESIMKAGITGYCKKYISEWKAGQPHQNP